MSQFIEATLTWTDNSSGSRNETGTEVQIYTDSPSFVPNVSPDIAIGVHPWMRLRTVNAGTATYALKLETPVTFVKVRVRQFNDSGYGEWDKIEGTLFQLTPASGSTAPNAPTQIGFTLVTPGTTPPPVPGPEPPPPPPPTSAANYVYSTQFSGVQGQNQWSYLDENGASMTYSGAAGKWSGDELYLAIWGNGFMHGWTTGKAAVLRWTAPANGSVRAVGTAKMYETGGSATFTIKHNSTQKFQQTMADTTDYPYDITATVVTNDVIDFILTRVSSGTNNNTQLNPQITFTTDGSTVQNPVLGTLSPSSFTTNVGGTTSLTVTLTAPALSNATVSVSSTDTGRITVPASVVIPTGQTSTAIVATGVATGSSTITATYNSVSKQSVGTVASPPSASWPNAPAGGTVLLDHNFSTVLGSGMTGGTGAPLSGLRSDPSAPMSPSSCFVSALQVGTNSGGSQLEFYTPGGTKYRELYAGVMWRVNPQWTGRAVGGDKMFFLRGPDSNGLIGLLNGQIKSGTPPVLCFFHNSGNVDNSHIMSNDLGLTGWPNVGNGTITPGVWYRVEFWIRCSTTLTSRDGAVKWWINGNAVGDYTQLNYGTAAAGLTNWIWTETWDGSGTPIHPVVLEHWLDHVYVVGKN